MITAREAHPEIFKLLLETKYGAVGKLPGLAPY
jgi:hypothetical protein